MCGAHYEIANQLSFLTRRTGPLKSETVASCDSMFEKKLVKIKGFEGPASCHKRIRTRI